MEYISARYGESVYLEIDTGDETNQTAQIFIGLPGETYIISQEIQLDNGLGYFSLSEEDTRVPLGKYRMQINIIDSNGLVSKFPDCGSSCGDDDFPIFEICEALDEMEVVTS